MPINVGLDDVRTLSEFCASSRSSTPAGHRVRGVQRLLFLPVTGSRLDESRRRPSSHRARHRRVTGLRARCCPSRRPGRTGRLVEETAPTAFRERVRLAGSASTNNCVETAKLANARVIDTRPSIRPATAIPLARDSDSPRSEGPRQRDRRKHGQRFSNSPMTRQGRLRRRVALRA